ncbi:MAG: type 1 glutamine amidotransferase-like domain-containing protein [bacterium]|nr:type 1 glutamine amidotransferase-like domain-containing protein [bacterium]
MTTPRTAPIVLLGPQRRALTARTALAPLLAAGDAVAAVTAGWEEREHEQVELVEHLGRKVHNLELRRRATDVAQRDPELDKALHARADTLRQLHDLYRLRLRHLAPAAEELLRRQRPAELIQTEREYALEDLRTLDAHHLERVEQVNRAFDTQYRPTERDVVARHRKEIAKLLQGSAALCIAGGHIRILLNRLRLFDVMGLVPSAMPIVAWSAGAMALSERVVLFHDSPPQGRGYAEVLCTGLGVCNGVVPLPHASERLQLSDHVRVQLLSRRFPDAICAVLDENTSLTWDGHAWQPGATTQQLTLGGALAAVGAGGAV